MLLLFVLTWSWRYQHVRCPAGTRVGRLFGAAHFFHGGSCGTTFVKLTATHPSFCFSMT